MTQSDYYFIIIGFSQVLIALVLLWNTIQDQRDNRKVYEQTFENHLKDMWNFSNQIILSDEKCLQSRMQQFSFVDNVDDMRKAYLYFIELNAVNSIFSGYQKGIIGKDEYESVVTGILDGILTDDLAYACAIEKGYPTAFKELCKRRKLILSGKIGELAQKR